MKWICKFAHRNEFFDPLVYRGENGAEKRYKGSMTPVIWLTEE